ncbi:Uncharacterised protein [Candidatus Burarchaeum australiense]|nr:Uncharacterised protein [Candidatus Burarchaeum australiense]
MGYYTDLRRILALAGIGLGLLGILLVIIAYLSALSSIGSTQAIVDAQFTNLDAILESGQKAVLNASSGFQDAPNAALGDINDALLAYAESSDGLASSFESMGSILPLGQMDEIGVKLRASAASLRSASLEFASMKGSFNSTATNLEETGVRMGEYRQELAVSHLERSATFDALRATCALVALAAIAGFLALIAIGGALLFDAP